MNGPPESDRHLDRVLLLFLLALFLLVSPLTEIWAADSAHWLSPFLLWGGIIALAYWLQRRRERPEP